VSSKAVRILFIADTHLGFDLPTSPRVNRRRRGHDFLANFKRALQPAVRGEVDLVVHGGDLLYRSKVPVALVEMALAPLVEVADRGVPVYIVPGNHERSRIPLHLWTAHPNIYIFHEPRTFLCSVGSTSIALAGFPFSGHIRDAFGELIGQTRYREVAADFHLLCMHQTVEGAQVGPSNFTFHRGPEVINGEDVPGAFTAVLAGHIHRAQVLTHDLAKEPLAAPVIYPGSIERTSFAERHEDKCYVTLTVGVSDKEWGQLKEVSFVPLPARPMIDLVLELESLGDQALDKHLRAQLQALDPQAIVRVRLNGSTPDAVRGRLSAAYLRALAPPTMNISLALHRNLAGTPNLGQLENPEVSG
jgi:exonuclease SbcD